MSEKKKLLLIGWDAADWKVIQPLIEAGKMPALQKLMSEGVYGNLATIEPALSPMLWTTIGTGKYPDKHGIHGFIEPTPETGEPRPVRSTSRKVKAIWNILTHQEYKTHLFGWWPSHPAEPINGICVSNFYQRANQSIKKPWPLAAGTVHPAKYNKIFKELRIHPDELTEAHILPFVPDAGKVDQDKDKRLGSLSKILADCASVHAASTWAMEHEEWDFMGVYHDAIDHFCHGFMKFHPPHRKGIPEDLYETYKDVVNGAYMFHDMMLERLLALAGPDVNVMLISDHGFQSDHLRPTYLPKEPAGPAYEHRPYGIICMKGPDIKVNEQIYGSTLLDITPTILTLFDLPVGKDMDGVPLLQAFKTPKEVKEIESWEKVTGHFGMHDEDMIEDPFVAQKSMEQLIELGYVEAPDKDPKQRIKNVETESQYNLARVYLGSNRPHLAIPILEKLNNDKEEERFLTRLVNAYKSTGEYDKSMILIPKLKKMQHKDSVGIDVMEASILIEQGEHEKALKLLQKINKKRSNRIASASFHLQMGHCFVRLKDWENAKKAFATALIIDPDKASAHHGIGLSFLRQEKYEKALEAFLNSTGLVYQYPIAHHHIGEALYHLGEYQAAVEAFTVALTMNPALSASKKWLKKIYKQEADMIKPEYKRKIETLENFNKEDLVPAQQKNFKAFRGKTKGEVIIVSGLPRSGTSMMMQMLEKGGMPVFTDKKRKADESNPKGYYEHEAIKATLKKKTWVNQAVGKAAKVISHLLLHMPPQFEYKVIFVQRDLGEVVSSQHKMLVKNGKARADSYPAGMEMAFRKNLNKIKKWAENTKNVQLLNIEHADVLRDPVTCANRISTFLGREMDIQAMASVVDRSLHRNKTAVKTGDQ